MLKTTFQLQNKELMKKLQSLPTDIQDKVIVKSVRAGANVIKKDAKKNAPSDTGYMKSRIKAQKARKSSNLGNFVFIVKVDSPVHHLIELGTDDRTSTKGRKLTFTGKNGADIYVYKVAGVKPIPFLGKAYSDNRDKVIEMFQSRLRAELNKF